MMRIHMWASPVVRHGLLLSSLTRTQAPSCVKQLISNVNQTQRRLISSSIIPEHLVGSAKPGISFEPKVADVEIATGVTKSTNVRDGLEIPDPNQVVDLRSFLVDENAGQLMSPAIDMTRLTANDLDLTWWCPTGGIFNVLNSLHEYMPWWGTIVVTTLGLRILLTKVVIMNQINAAKMSHVAPQMQMAQAKFQKMKRIGNQMEISKAAMELQEVMKKTNASLMSTMLSPMIQAPIFLSMFWVLRSMSNLPVESLKTEGLFWFTDLTLSDPTFILPLVTSASLFVVIKLGVDFGARSGQMQSPMIQKAFLYGLPPFVFVCTYSFQSAILLYWMTSNLISVGQVLILQQPGVRTYFGIPPTKKWAKDEMPETAHKKGFKAGMMESWESMQLSKKVAERKQIQAREFEKAAHGPVTKTYKYDPTKSNPH